MSTRRELTQALSEHLIEAGLALQKGIELSPNNEGFTGKDWEILDRAVRMIGINILSEIKRLVETPEDA